AAHCEREADAAAYDPADPYVIAACARHYRDQRGVDDRLEAEVRTRKDDRQDQASLRDERTAREDVEPERDQVDRERRVDERVVQRPAAHEAGRLSNEHRALLIRRLTGDGRHAASLPIR